MEGRGPNFVVEDRFLCESALTSTLEHLRRVSEQLPRWSESAFGSHWNALYASLSWERPLLHAALVELQRSGDVLTSLHVLCRESVAACAARRRATFVAVCQAVRVGGDAGVEKRVERALHLALDEFKDSAFRSVFLLPSEHFFRGVANHVMEGDVGVHGVNAYAALLYEFSPVRLSLCPLMEDDVKGVVDFLAVDSFVPHVQKLWARERFGQGIAASWAGAHGASAGMDFIFEHWGGNVERLCRAARDASTQAQRDQFGVYVAQFHSNFSPDFMLQRLFTRLSNDDLFLRDATELLASKGDTGVPRNFREWVWQMDGDTPTFSLERATLFFKALGFVKRTVQPSQMHLYACSPPELRLGMGRVPPRASLEGGDERDVPVGERIPHALITLEAAGDICGGGTGLEFVSNLANDSFEPWDKWLHPGHVQKSWVKAVLAQPCVVTGYSLCSANDYPERDPRAWHVDVVLAESKRVVRVSEFRLENNNNHFSPFARRWHYRYFKLDHACLASEVVLYIDDVARMGDGIQLGHWHLEGYVAERHEDHHQYHHHDSACVLC